MTAARSRPAAEPTPPPPAATPAPVHPDRVLPAPPFPPSRRPGAGRAAGIRWWRRTWPWFVAVAAVVLVVITELGLLQGRLAADLSRLRDAAGSPTVPASAPTPGLAPVPVVAPAAAGDVSAVRLRLLDPPCAPGAPCTVVVAVDHRPGVTPTDASWTVLVADRCRGTVVPSGAGVTPATTGAYGVATVLLPPGRALALLAVTAPPSSAASTAVPVGAGPC